MPDEPARCARCNGTGVEPARARSPDVRVIGGYCLALLRRHRGWLLEIRETIDAGVQRVRFRREADARHWFERIQSVGDLAAMLEQTGVRR